MFYEESLGLRRELEDSRGTALTLNNLGIVAQLRGDYDRAVALLEESLALFRALGDEWGVALSLLTLGSMAQWQGDLAQGDGALRREPGAVPGARRHARHRRRAEQPGDPRQQPG